MSGAGFPGFAHARAQILTQNEIKNFDFFFQWKYFYFPIDEQIYQVNQTQLLRTVKAVLTLLGADFPGFAHAWAQILTQKKIKNFDCFSNENYFLNKFTKSTKLDC